MHKIASAILMPLLAGALGFLLGQLVITTSGELAERDYPLPHHIPPHRGNLTLRFAMVHDVVHERFARHGPPYYLARNESTRAALKKLNPSEKGADADKYFLLLDDLAVGLVFLGQYEDAVGRMRQKLDRQQQLGYADDAMYSSFANLGTFLILWQLSEGVDDVPRARQRISESVKWIKRAIEVNAKAHFGREKWQLILEEFLLAVLDQPELLLRYDMIGDRLDQTFSARGVAFDEGAWLRGNRFQNRGMATLAEEAGRYLLDPASKEDPSRYRAAITRVGAEAGWKEAGKTSLKEPTAFDEPALGIVGMWRMGAGANPHFALALGEIMLRVGQNSIAWSAFERAQRLLSLAGLAGVLTVYNFVRFGFAWQSKRRRGRDDDVALCPTCGRPMRLQRDDSNPSRYKIVCCGCELHVTNEAERRQMVDRLKRYHGLNG